MHIAYCHYIPRGYTASHHARQFAEAARRLGHRIDVFGMDSTDSATSDRPLAGLGASIRTGLKRPLRRYLHEPKELLLNLPYFWREIRCLRGQRPDVLLFRSRYLGASCVAVARCLRLPLVIEVNAPVSEARLYRDHYFHLPWIPENLTGRTLRRADGLTAVSSALKDYLIESHGLSPDRITVVPNGADVRRFRPDVCPDPQLAQNFRQNPVVGFVGSFRKFHGPELLARMALRVAEVRPRVHFVFVGDGPQAALMRSLRERLGARLLLTGSVAHDRVPGLVAGFDIAVMPESNFYGSPLKVIEWMAAGRAVVAPAYGPLEEIIDSGREGLLFPPGDEDALVQSVLELVDDPDRLAALGQGAAARVRSSLTWEDNARRVIAACRKALMEHRSATRRAS